MKHICYIYIFEYKCLKNIEFILDSHYSYRFEPDNKTLTIKKNKKFPSNFWGNNIYSVTALVGNNGSGKSTAMSFLLDFLVEGSANKSVNGIIVYENKGRLYYFGRNISATFEGNSLESNSTLISLNKEFGRMPCFYYSGHFSPYINNDPRNNCLEDSSYFASDIVRLVEDYQNDTNEDSIQLPNYLNSHIAQNNYRICMMLANKELSRIIKGFTLPKYVILGINQSGETSIKSSIKKENNQKEQFRNNIINTCYNIIRLYKKMYDKEKEKEVEYKKKEIEYYKKIGEIREEDKLGKNRPVIADMPGSMGDKDMENRNSKESEDYQPLIRKYNDEAMEYYSDGKYAMALEKYKRVLEIRIRESKSDKNYRDTAITYSNIAKVYYDMGDYAKALDYFEKAKDIFESELDKDHPYTATTYNNIAGVYENMGDYDKALKYYEKAKEIREPKLGKDHPDTATTYNDIAGVYVDMGDYSKAMEYYEKAMEIRKSKLGEDHLSTAETYNNIALVHNAKGDYDKALEFYGKTKDVFESKLGEEHPSTATIYNNIAGVYKDKGESSRALEYFNKALKIRESKLGESHPDTIVTYNNIAGVYRAMGDYNEAMKYYNMAEEIEKVKNSKNSQDVALIRINAAKEYEDKGNYNKALQLYEEDLRINEEELKKISVGTIIPTFKKVFYLSGENHFWSQMIYHNLLNITCYKWNWKNGFGIINDWQDHLKNNNVPVLDQFSDYINSIFDDEKKETLKSLKNILQETKKLSIYKTDSSGNGFLCIDCKENNNLVNLGERVLKNGLFMTSKLFDFSYAQALDSETILSSGEQELLNLFSRIYDAIELRTKEFTNQESSCLVMLDEAEIGFHPDWQRRYLNLVIEFLNKLGAIKKKELDFQIIISTHSPILLSDIPKCCTNYLKVDNGKTINANRDEIGETFAANVFNLYRMSFFMEEGLVGEFAREKITKLEKRIEKGETKNIVQEINMIGDEGIREYLLESFYQKHPEKNSINERLIEYYKNKISQLQKGKEYKDE